MATPSQIKSALDDIANRIVQERSRLTGAKAAITSAETTLAAMPTQYADVINAINALDGTDPFEALAKDELSKLAAEFNALLAVATTAKDAVNTILNGE